MAYQKVQISHRAANETPNRVYYESETVTAYESLIPYDYETAQKIHFVTGKDGQEFGQFETEEKATEIASQATQWYEQQAFSN